MFTSNSNSDNVKEASPEDVGTRLTHMMDLYDLWSMALDVLENQKAGQYSKSYSSVLYELRVKELKTALSMLLSYIQIISNYNKSIKQLEKRIKDIKGE